LRKTGPAGKRRFLAYALLEAQEFKEEEGDKTSLPIEVSIQTYQKPNSHAAIAWVIM